MDEWWEKFEASGKVSDYLAYCKKAEEESHGIQYCSDGDGSFGDSCGRVRQENNDSDKRTWQDHGFC